MTESGEIYYCEYNSQTSSQKIYSNTSLKEAEKNKGYRNILSSCMKKKCNTGEYYYINNNYYQCKKESIFSLMKMEQCIDFSDVQYIKEKHTDISKTKGFGKYIIHFPISDKTSYPKNIKYLNYLITIHNNSTAEDARVIDNLPTISGVFQNCRYNLETSTIVFDLICMNNYVVLAKDLVKQNSEMKRMKENGFYKGNTKNYDISGVFSYLKRRANGENNDNDENNKKDKYLEEFNLTYRENSDPYICSSQNFGYIECQKDSNNPDKCIPSKAKTKYILSINTLILILVLHIFHILLI